MTTLTRQLQELEQRIAQATHELQSVQQQLRSVGQQVQQFENQGPDVVPGAGKYVGNYAASGYAYGTTGSSTGGSFGTRYGQSQSGNQYGSTKDIQGAYVSQRTPTSSQGITPGSTQGTTPQWGGTMPTTSGMDQRTFQHASQRGTLHSGVESSDWQNRATHTASTHPGRQSEHTTYGREQ